MRIWKKIILGFSSVILILILVNFNALWNNIIIIRMVNKLELTNRVELSQSNTIAYTVQRLKSNMRELFLEAKEGIEYSEIIRARQIVESSMPILSESIMKIRETTIIGHELYGDDDVYKESEELMKIDSLDKMVSVFSSSIIEILSMQDQQMFDESEVIFEKRAEPISRHIQELILVIKQDAEEEVSMSIKQMETQVDFAIKLGIYLTILSTLFAMGIGLYISRSISNPLNNLISGVNEIGKGNLDTQVELNTKGELQKLALSFNKMAKELKQKITSIDNLNKELVESNNTKDKLFSIIAHDLRGPFNSILGFSDLLFENLQEFEIAETKELLGIINASAKNTLVLLDNLLNWAKSQTGQINFKPEKVVLSPIIQEVFELSNSSAQNKNIVLNYIQSEEIVVLADSNMIKTVLRNLISNAIKFTNSNGKIDVYALQNDKFIEIAVSDNGVGMNEETRNKLFSIETNETTLGTANEKGSGLGLLLCKEFVEKHGGKIWIESEEGKGSIFYFTLPYQTETIIEKSAENEILLPVEDTSINKLKILIIEDDETSEMLLSIAVQKLGSEIISVKTGTEAVVACLNNPDIDVVLMDIQMPGMNGYEATSKIREFNKDVIIIAQTAFALEGDREKAIASGCNDYLAKPIKKNELLKKIEKLLS